MTDVFIGLFGAAAFAFAVLVVTVRQPMRAALALISHMVCLAALFACLNVHVVALFQVLIYVGAVMVFMVYAIMLLDDRDASYLHVFSRWSVPALVTAVLVVVALGLFIGGASAPAAVADAAQGGRFSFSVFSLEFMANYWFHFELATVLLVIDILAAWTVIAEPR